MHTPPRDSSPPEPVAGAPAEQAPAPTVGSRQTLFVSFGKFATVCCACLLASAAIFPNASRGRESSRRAADASNLRQIAMASLIAADELGADRLPGADAKDVWDYARITALHGSLNDASIWASHVESAQEEARGRLSTVLTPNRDALDSAFAAYKPGWAVALHPELTINLPPTTPIAWTRGLRADGTWAPHAPNGDSGGHVVFLNLDVMFLRHTRDAFERFGGGGKTTNILEALPPESRIAEYTPTGAEADEWARLNRIDPARTPMVVLALPAAWAAGLLLLLVQAIRRRWPFAWTLWYLILSFLAASLMPTC